MQVPVYERQARQEGIPNAQQNIQVDASNFLGGTEAAALKFGEHAANELNNAVQHHYAEQLKDAKQTRLLDASTQMQAHVQDAMYGSNGALTKSGADAFLGSNGKTVSDLTFDDALKRQNEIADTLGDEEQKTAFKQHTNSMLMSMRGQLMGHEAQQHRVYTQSTLESSNAVQQRNIELGYNNTPDMQTSVAQLKANSNQLAKLHGYDQGWADVHAQTNISGALGNAVDAAIGNQDHKTALNIMQNFAKDMNQNDLLKNYKKITKVQDETAAVNAVTSTVQSFAGAFNPQDGDRLTNLIRGAESSHQHFQENGQPTTSSEGATGAMQVMPNTGPEAAKLAGVQWNKELFNRARTGNKALDDEATAYNNKLGTAYFQKQLQDNHGDIQLALASYNAGPDATQKAVKDAQKSGGDWLSLLPKETQQYVAKISEQFAAGGGKPMPPTLQQLQNHALGQLPNPTLEQRQIVLQEASRQHTVNQAAIKDYEDYTVGEALRTLDNNGGDYNGLPTQLRTALPPEKIAAVQGFAEKIAQHQDLQNNQRWAEFQSLPTSELAKMTPASFYAEHRTHLDTAHLEKGEAIITAARAQATGKVPKQDHLEIFSTSERIKKAAQAATILPSLGGKVSEDQSQRFGQFETTIEQRVRDFENRAPGNRKASSEELQHIIDTTLLDTVSVDEFGRDPKRPLVTLNDTELNKAYVTIGKEDIKLASIPLAQRSTIINKLQSRNLPVTENAIAQLWVSANKPQ